MRHPLRGGASGARLSPGRPQPRNRQELSKKVATATQDLATLRSIDAVQFFAELPMSEPLSLSLGQQFELERMSRAIEATTDLETLQGLAKQLLQAWHSQKAATQWVMRQQLGSSPQFASSSGLDQLPS
jgi:hypothetical protein